MCFHEKKKIIRPHFWLYNTYIRRNIHWNLTCAENTKLNVCNTFYSHILMLYKYFNPHNTVRFLAILHLKHWLSREGVFQKVLISFGRKLICKSVWKIRFVLLFLFQKRIIKLQLIAQKFISYLLCILPKSTFEY